MPEPEWDARVHLAIEAERRGPAKVYDKFRTSEPSQEFRLSDAARAELEQLARRYPNTEALMLPALWLVQREAGWISPAAMEHVGELLGVSAVRVYSVVTFYHMFHEAPPGRYNVQVCHNLSCSLLGAERLLARLHARLGVGENEPTPDGRFMIQRVECLGACEHAPVCQINDKFEFDVNPEKLDRLLDALAGDAKEAP